MNEIDRLKKELADAVKNSEEYKKYIYCRKLLAENPMLEREVNELRRQNFEFQFANPEMAANKGMEDVFARIDFIRTEAPAGDFLKYELGLCRIIQDIYKTILFEIDFDLDFLK